MNEKELESSLRMIAVKTIICCVSVVTLGFGVLFIANAIIELLVTGNFNLGKIFFGCFLSSVWGLLILCYTDRDKMFE